MPDPKRYDEFADLVRRSTSQMLTYIHAILLNWNDTEDVFQETCIVLWQRFGDFEPGTNFLAWALRVANNKTLDFLKRRSRRITFSADLRDELLVEVVDRGADEAAVNLDALSNCMKRLSADDKRMVMLCHGEGIPVRRIADMLGRSPQSVHHSLRRICTCLLQCIRREVRCESIRFQGRRAVSEEGSP